MMMQITELTEQDLESLAGLYRQFWNEESDVRKMRDTFRHLAGNPDYIFLGAKRDGQLVGSVMGIVCEELYGQCQPFMVVEDVVVDEGHQRQGIGSQLMRELEQRAKERGCGYIIFVTEQDRTTAHRFYESLGYCPDKYRGFKKRLETATA
jgi:ribosomal protein S18 acetylase RimI-like enzyme